MIPEFPQPSNAKNKIYLRAATVKQARGFSDVVEEHSERITTEFLNVVQVPEFFTDSAEWTEGDRITALYWYHVHTAKDTFVSIPYHCEFCDKDHSNYFDTRLLAEPFQNLQGKAYRETDVLGRKLTFEPLTGADLDAIQEIKRDLPMGARVEDEMAFERLVRAFHFTGLSSKTLEDRIEWVQGLEISDYWELLEVFLQTQDSMKHGVRYKYKTGDVCFIVPPHHCINKHELAESAKEGAVTQLLWPFLCGDFIPTLQPR